MLAQATFLQEFALLGECLRRIGGSRREWPFIPFDSIAAVHAAVMVAPGMTALTKIPWWPHSTAIECLTAIRPALAAP